MNAMQVKAIALGQSAHSNARFEPMGSRNNRLQHELTGLCKQMRGLLKHATAKKKHKRSLCEQSQTLRQQSVLIWQISQDESWAWIWAQQAMTRDALKKDVRELLNEFVIKWSLQPHAEAADYHLTLVQSRRSTGRKYEQHFRRRWICNLRKLKNVLSWTRDELRKNAGFLVTWTQWLVQHTKSHGPCVVVNLDETSVSNMSHGQNGTIMSRTSQEKTACTKQACTTQCHKGNFDGMRVQ